MKKLLSVVLTIALILTSAVYVFAEEKILKVAVDSNLEPFEYHENGVLTGFDIELMNFLAERLGYKVEYFECPFDIVFMSVMSGQSDCAISAISITEERKKNLYYTEPYIYYEKDGVRDYLGIPSNNETLRDELNNQLAIAKASGIVDNLLAKYNLTESEGYFTFYENTEDHSIDGISSDWAKESVDIAFRAGITDGTRYAYKSPITREKFCELIYNLILAVKKEISATHPENITDTDNRKMLVLAGLGIINGKNQTELAPNDFLTREEAATIIVRMINKAMPMAATEMWFSYDDIAEISDWASDSVQIISNLGFMQGVGENKFAPKETYTTEQAIATLVRVLKSAGEAGLVDEETSMGIIGGADGPTAIIIGGETTVTGNTAEKIDVTETVKINDFYIDEAVKLVTESCELAKDKEFIGMYTANDDITEKISSIGDIVCNEPAEIYFMSANREEIMKNIREIYNGEENFDVEKLTEDKFEKLWNRMNFSALAGMINASYGSENLAALSILANSEGYVMPKDFKRDFALFLQYDGEYSALVSFSEYGEGVISANMTFVKNGNKDNIFSRLYEITSVLGENSIDVAYVK